MRNHIFILTLLITLSCRNIEKPKQITAPAKISKQTWDRMSESGWRQFQEVDYTYNQFGQLVSETTFLISDSSKTYKTLTERAYKENGNEIRVVRKIRRDSIWIFAKDVSFKWKNDYIQMRVDSIPGNPATLIHTKYNYNREMELIEEISWKIQDSDSLIFFKIEYRYDNNSKPITKLFFRGEAEGWQTLRKMDLAYNYSGHHISTTRYNWINEEWKKTIDYELIVDNYGVRQTEIWRQTQDTVQKETTRVKYQYFSQK